ncbi:MAG: cardiolipin synthase ClsB [Candidatus Nitricoxidivorans perseverans]|uniref:Cardiolipin synthase B n=1 Tax=Candidatus Nitricoxidivorans perseverans TaxID=2975601 RepID=A0AA49FIM6_9PROT|nr:MAG: cardiolipin synthase ClsB [Candidatus Nitricoxidivorans perseverans]
MKPEYLPGNRVTLLTTGREYFPALIEAIDGAVAEVHFETYIFADDDAGRAVAAALARAAKRGVAVRVLVDGFGAREFSAGLGARLAADGAEVLVYRPEIARMRLRRHRLRRLHRKLAVIDARVAFVGGINVIDDWDGADRRIPPRHDYAVRVEGPLLAHIHHATRHLWQLVSWASLRRRYREPPPSHRVAHDPAPHGGTTAAFLVRDNLRHRRDIEENYLDAIESAKDEIVLASAYFLPGRRFRHALMGAAQRGVRVIVLLQGRVEYALLHYATQALHGALLKAGVRIFEYHASFLHAKVAVVDGDWATVGSSNIDPFSLLLAREANVAVRDAGFAAGLRENLTSAMAASAREVRAEDLKRRSLPARAASWLAYSAVRLLIGIAGYGSSDYRG